MNADERTPGQQGYGQQSPQQSETGGDRSSSRGGQDADMTDEGRAGDMTTGQASYGNSGETDTLSQNSSSSGQESDMGQGGDGGLFNSSQEDRGGSAPSQAAGQQPSSSGQASSEQGQDAQSEDLMGSDDDSGTTDIEIERSQGRESDVEGSSL